MKRSFDVVVAGLVLILSAPLLLVLAVAIRISMGGPILFRQRRPGLNGQCFLMYKFRTMRVGCDANGRVLSDAERLTRLGTFLRSTSLDELPELINVIKGEMSLVGPRPLLVEYLPRYTPAQNRRHEVRPGITGWAQVNGRNALSWEARFELDVWYVDHRSFRLDLIILATTIRKVVLREGISHEGHATMEIFRGTPA